MMKNTYSTRDEIQSGITPPERVSSLVGAIVGTLVGLVFVIIGALSQHKSKQTPKSPESDVVTSNGCSSGIGIIFIVVGVIVSASCWLWWYIVRKSKSDSDW